MSTDPTALAREVLEAQAAFDRDAEDAAHYGEVCDRLNEVVDRAAPTLARAVIDLTAERDAYREENTCLREDRARAEIDLTDMVERMEALADELDREASEHMDRPVYSRSGTRIRAALNEDSA